MDAEDAIAPEAAEAERSEAKPWFDWIQGMFNI